MRICQASPHPVRDPTGHSYHVEPIRVAAEASLSSDAFLWGLDLFNHGYYWEAHEAWEGLWRVADRDGPLRMLFKGLILLSAAGVKIRERKNAAAARHAMRAAALLRQLMKVPDTAFERALGMSPATLAECAEAATRISGELQATAPGHVMV
jgi:predicted metal-dependent hydrolase